MGKLLDSIGITITVSALPEYIAYGKLDYELARMNPVRRWLSFRKRRELKRLLFEAQQATLIAAMEAADNALD